MSNTHNGIFLADGSGNLKEYGNTGGGGSGASSADDISYDNASSDLSATDVQGAIDEIDGIATANRFTEKFVDISGYTSQSNLYTFPSDGYVSVIVYNGDTSGLIIYGADGYTSGRLLQSLLVAPTNGFNSDCVFVRKGMKCYFQDPISVSGSAARFQPLSQ